MGFWGRLRACAAADGPQASAGAAPAAAFARWALWAEGAARRGAAAGPLRRRAGLGLALLFAPARAGSAGPVRAERAGPAALRSCGAAALPGAGYQAVLIAGRAAGAPGAVRAQGGR